MSAYLAFAAAIGSLISWSDGTPRPPERHSKKLAVWKMRNSSGRLIRKEDSRTLGNYTAPASFTLHEGDIGGRGTIVVTILRSFGVDSTLASTVIERPPIGSVRVFDRPGPSHDLIHLATNRAAAEAWLKLHRHPMVVLEEVTADEVAADHVEGRAA
ncbi:hypothetical protein [Agrobacterium tumefaciens]|uniref:Uncharacterized protein n=1 Tax=Agrobacterium tumefaciens TaxID=358 RepID=A0A2L2LMP7_AGRTU|nr:hypothetical protein [Agrobacterium tumefaciens]AVH45566.1 hypothetical protein At1D1609_55350 [Agrobacterium tumefaciens]NSY99362.1 hypothetical protein [Agrobacterium tumefaciens]